MLCDIYKYQSPKMVPTKWANNMWREIDVDHGGSINFESFCAWYLNYFDPISGKRLDGGEMARGARCAENPENGKLARRSFDRKNTRSVTSPQEYNTNLKARLQDVAASAA
jgi:hypothetical protein